MKNYTIVHLTKFRDDTIINNGEKKKDKEKVTKDPIEKGQMGFLKHSSSFI